MTNKPRRIALVLAGGAAHGAYEVGVIQHIVCDVARDVGPRARFDILCGTSAGAVNACALAATADDAPAGAEHLAAMWRELRLDETLRLSLRGVLALAGALVSTRFRRSRRASLVAARPILDILERSIPFGRIDDNLRAHRLTALAVTTTHIGSGRTVVFVEARQPLHEGDRNNTVFRRDRIGASHVLASAAVPILFPPVELDGQLYCDGGLRQMLPLAPALRLGADGLVVVNPRHPPEEESAETLRSRERAYGSPVFLVGRTLDVLLVDRVREDLNRLQQINALLEAGTNRYGSGFLREINAGLARSLRPRTIVEIRTSEDVARLAADFVRSPRFAARAGRGHTRIFRWLADAEGTPETTVLSYLLFDGEFAATLMELGRADARAQHDKLCALFADDVNAASA